VSLPGLALVVGLLAAPRVRAAPGLELAVDGCAGLDQARLRELIAIEMNTLAPAPPVGRTRVRLACFGERLEVDLSNERGAPTSRSWLDLHGTAEETRPRLMALAITELVAMSLNEAPPPAAAATPAAPPAREVGIVARPEPPRAPPAWRLFAASGLRRAGRPGAWLAAGGLGGERRWASGLGLAVDVRFEAGGADTSIAAVDLRGVVATAAVSFGGGGGRLSWGALPGFSVGLVRLAATPHAADARGATLDAAWAGPSLALRGRCGLGRSSFVQGEAAGGLTSRRVSGLVDAGSPLFELRGPWLSLGLAGGVSF
jgi:hypothetical protein